jgi:2-polyprenyl-6-hydroxyphenyl methylase/3-demethylubiquinone-9 3-methyltransferase
LRLDRFADPRDLCDYYKANFGPTIATYAALAGDPDRLAELDGDFLAFATEHAHRDPNGTTTYEYEYLVAIARRADGRVL